MCFKIKFKTKSSVTVIIRCASEVDGAYTFDLDKARQLLEEAGYGTPIEVDEITIQKSKKELQYS